MILMRVGLILFLLSSVGLAQDQENCLKPEVNANIETINTLESQINQVVYNEKQTQKLFNAILSNNLSEVKLALKNGANPNAFNDDFKYYRNPKAFGKDYLGFNVLSFALNKSSKEIVKALLDSGADVNLSNRNGKATTPLIEVARDNSVQFLDVLLDPKYKIDVNKTAASGRSALHFAGTNNSAEVIKRLVTIKGIDLNKESFIVVGKGDTALTAMCFYGYTASVKTLLNHPIDSEIKPMTLDHLNKALESANADQKAEIELLINDYKKKHSL
jgi:ankyrin repeat protein